MVMEVGGGYMGNDRYIEKPWNILSCTKMLSIYTHFTPDSTRREENVVISYLAK